MEEKVKKKRKVTPRRSDSRRKINSVDGEKTDTQIMRLLKKKD